MIAVSVLHMMVLGLDAAPYLGQWIRLQLWSMEHWKPISTQSFEMLSSNAAFWSTLGSFAVPTGILGYVLLWADRKNMTIPVGVGWAFLVWQLLCTLVIEPAGFVIGLVIAVALLIGLYQDRGAGPADSRHEQHDRFAPFE